jgi:hypothetical protein
MIRFEIARSSLRDIRKVLPLHPVAQVLNTWKCTIQLLKKKKSIATMKMMRSQDFYKALLSIVSNPKDLKTLTQAGSSLSPEDIDKGKTNHRVYF